MVDNIGLKQIAICVYGIKWSNLYVNSISAMNMHIFQKLANIARGFTPNGKMMHIQIIEMIFFSNSILKVQSLLPFTKGMAWFKLEIGIKQLVKENIWIYRILSIHFVPKKKEIKGAANIVNKPIIGNVKNVITFKSLINAFCILISSFCILDNIGNDILLKIPTNKLGIKIAMV